MLNTFFGGEKAGMRRRKQRWEEGGREGQQRWEKMGNGMGLSLVSAGHEPRQVSGQVGCADCAWCHLQAVFEAVVDQPVVPEVTGNLEGRGSPAKAIWLLFLGEDAKVCVG